MKADISKVGLGFAVSILMVLNVVFAQGFQDAISTFKEIGVFQFYLPFIIVFAIFYGLLDKTKLFGDKRIFSVLVALGAAGFILVYTPVGITFSQFLTNFVGQTITVILTLTVVLIVVTMLQTGGIIKKPEGDKTLLGNVWIPLALVALIAFGVFLSSGGTAIFPGLKIGVNQIFGDIGGLSSGTVAILVLILGTGLIVYLFSKDTQTKPT